MFNFHDSTITISNYINKIGGARACDITFNSDVIGGTVEEAILHWETLLRVVETTAWGFLRKTPNCGQ